MFVQQFFQKLKWKMVYFKLTILVIFKENEINLSIQSIGQKQQKVKIQINEHEKLDQTIKSIFSGEKQKSNFKKSLFTSKIAEISRISEMEQKNNSTISLLFPEDYKDDTNMLKKLEENNEEGNFKNGIKY